MLTLTWMKPFLILLSSREFGKSQLFPPLPFIAWWQRRGQRGVHGQVCSWYSDQVNMINWPRWNASSWQEHGLWLQSLDSAVGLSFLGASAAARRVCAAPQRPPHTDGLRRVMVGVWPSLRAKEKVTKL